MISYTQALELIRKHAHIINTEMIELKSALGRIASTDIFSPLDLPTFNNSAMDGFAVKSKDCQLATPENPVLLAVGMTLQARANIQIELEAECSAIMTGAPVPDIYDAVIPIEFVELTEIAKKKYISINSPVKAGANLRLIGQDVSKNQLIVKAGTQLRAQDIMLLAACGISQIKVYTKISLAIATTGEEISDNYQQALEFGEIYNANAPLLESLANMPALEARYAGILGDDPKFLKEFIKNSKEQILITTGAVSMGEWDFIPQTLKMLGAEIIFHKVAIRPGKPILFAILNDGRYFFGLPGNPVSSFVGWRFFVFPLLRYLMHLSEEIGIKAKVENNFIKKHSLRQFLRANLEINQAQVQIIISADQESFKIHTLTCNNVWAIAEESQHQINQGELITILPAIPDFNLK